MENKVTTPLADVEGSQETTRDGLRFCPLCHSRRVEGFGAAMVRCNDCQCQAPRSTWNTRSLDASGYVRGASNMKDEIVKRVRDFDGWAWCECSECRSDAHAHAIDTRKSLTALATELEAIDLSQHQETKKGK